ncbi:MAG: ABC transporter ATP-binding protein [Bacteroidaceae bacterium]|jgi:iron complex transport system ATP-binding protein
MLEASQLAIGYRTRRGFTCVRRDVDLQLAPGEFACLLGANGSGKSTLLRTLSGLQAPLAGVIHLDGEPLAGLSPKERARKLAVVLTDRFEVPHLSVRAFVAWSRSPYTGLSARFTADDEARVDQSLRSAGIGHLAARSLHSLSDGERQRALVAAALCQDTPYILLDEPTAHLDLPNRVELLLLLSRLAHEEGKGILLSTHELDLALQTADSFRLLAPDGHNYSGTPAELARLGLLEQAFRSPSFRIDAETMRMEIVRGARD